MKKNTHITLLMILFCSTITLVWGVKENRFFLDSSKNCYDSRSKAIRVRPGPGIHEVKVTGSTPKGSGEVIVRYISGSQYGIASLAPGESIKIKTTTNDAMDFFFLDENVNDNSGHLTVYLDGKSYKVDAVSNCYDSTSKAVRIRKDPGWHSVYVTGSTPNGCSELIVRYIYNGHYSICSLGKGEIINFRTDTRDAVEFFFLDENTADNSGGLSVTFE